MRKAGVQHRHSAGHMFRRRIKQLLVAQVFAAINPTVLRNNFKTLLREHKLSLTHHTSSTHI